MATRGIPLARQIDRVPSTPVTLDARQELRFQSLMEDLVMVDIHQHQMVAVQLHLDGLGGGERTLRSNFGAEIVAIPFGGGIGVFAAEMEMVLDDFHGLPPVINRF